jgi:signal transduction histidine kinase
MDPTFLVIALLITVVLLTIGVGVLMVVLTRSKASQKALDAARAEALTAEWAIIEQRAVEAERRRILREMHDIIAHSLAIMVAQADGGSYVTGDPEASKRAFMTIADTGRTAVNETRRVLGILKTPELDDSLTPVPDQFSIDRLIEHSRDAGMEVYLIRLGEPRTLPAGLGLTLYRICQEALTNVWKHAGSKAKVTVTENWRQSDVVVTVTNQMGVRSTRVSFGVGQGILGMKERAQLAGGSLVAGPHEDGFRVRMVLPIPDPDGDLTLPTLPQYAGRNEDD